MSSIVAGVNAERTNRWLLIGAAVLAVLAGVLVFALLANFGDDDGSSGSGASTAGDTDVLVANQTINAGTEVTADMFEVASFDAKYIVPDAVNDAEALIGQTARVKILEGQQVSAQAFVGGVDDTFDDQLTFKVPEGMRAYAMSISEDTAVGGLLVPGDRVDIVVRYSTKTNADARDKQIHFELFAENVEVLARAQTDVEQSAVIDTTANDAAPVEDDPGAAGVARRPEEIDPDPGAGTVTLALTPDQVLRLGQYEVLLDGEISIALRKYGDDAPSGTQPVIITVLEN
jgi:pilus assembly protein CpaB